MRWSAFVENLLFPFWTQTFLPVKPVFVKVVVFGRSKQMHEVAREESFCVVDFYIGFVAEWLYHYGPGCS